MTEEYNPDGNMRRLKRRIVNQKLVYTLESDSESRTDKNVLCNFCAFSVEIEGEDRCPIYDVIKDNKQKGVFSMVRSCQDYRPILTFRPPVKNFDKDFNTFRLGMAWVNRVSPGTVVGLQRTDTGEVFGTAVVTQVFSGDYEDMCDEHAVMNHSLLDMPSDRSASDEIRKIISKMFGRAPLQNRPMMTVIYLRNRKYEPGS